MQWNVKNKIIPAFCFRDCSSLSAFDFSNVEYVGEEAFSGSGLREVYFTQSTNKIEENAFSGCQYLIKVEWLSDYSIVDKVFENCRNLKEVNISDKVKNIATDAFKGCPNVEFTFI